MNEEGRASKKRSKTGETHNVCMNGFSFSVLFIMEGWVFKHGFPLSLSFSDVERENLCFSA